MILTNSGKLFCCGSDSAMQLGCVTILLFIFTDLVNKIQVLMYCSILSGRNNSVSSWLKNDEDSAKVFSAVPQPIDLPADLQGKQFISVSVGNNFTAAIIKLVLT